MNDTNTTDESLSPLEAAEQAAKAAGDEHATAQEKLTAAREAHAQAEQDYDADPTDLVWARVRDAADLVARAERDLSRLERVAMDAAHAHTVERIADLARRAHLLKADACLDEVLPPYLEKLTALWSQLGEAEQETLAALEAAELKQAEILHLQLEADDLELKRKIEHPGRPGGFPRFPDMVRRRSHFPHAYIQSELTKRIKPDHRDRRVALLPAVQAHNADTAMMLESARQNSEIAKATREAIKAKHAELDAAHEA